MSDLISRSELLEELKSLKIVLNGKQIFFDDAKDTVLRIVNELPTAYSVENVVEELEIERKTANNTYNSFNMDVDLGRVFGLEKAIEIVKQGGVADDVCKKLVWYRFKTKSVDDYRPLIDMKGIQMPWWCAGTALDDSYVVIVCYLPKGEDLYKYWDDAYDVESADRTKIRYTDRFPKPDWIKEVE